MIIFDRRMCMVAFLGSVAAGVGFGWYFRTSSGPPGDWMPTATPAEREAAFKKEQSWKQCAFIRITSPDILAAALAAIPIRVLSSVEPSELDALRNEIHNQLIARESGSLDYYLKETREGTRPVIDDRNRDRIKSKCRYVLGEDFDEMAAPQSFFERFWRREYETEGGGRRFRDVCLESGGALIVIGDVTDDRVMTLLSPEEQERWLTWRGARRLHSTEMFLGQRSLEDILSTRSTCKMADVVLTIRSYNDDIWCWYTRWYMDPDDGDWALHGSWAVCSRRRYDVPI